MQISSVEKNDPKIVFLYYAGLYCCQRNERSYLESDTGPQLLHMMCLIHEDNRPKLHFVLGGDSLCSALSVWLHDSVSYIAFLQVPLILDIIIIVVVIIITIFIINICYSIDCYSSSFPYFPFPLALISMFRTVQHYK